MKTNMENNTGMYLLKKGKKGILRLIFSRIGLMVVMLLIQFGVLLSIFHWFEGTLPYFWGGTIVFSVGIFFHMLNENMDPTVKITWLIVILVLPVFGSLFYVYVQSDWGHRLVKARLNQIYDHTKEEIPQDPVVYEKLKEENPGAAALTHYMKRGGNFPVYQNTEVTFFPLGENKWEELLIQLKKAEKFIFLEYFIIEEGLMWGTILEILAHKVAEGVDVRVMYDGTCEFSTLSHDYPKRMEKLGIKCKMFSPITPFLSTHYNYRDHRKILVIDGKVAFNGGVNLADEYINHIEKHGHWKDTAVMLQGEAVKSFTLMFLQMWNLNEKEEIYTPYLEQEPADHMVETGFLMPYGDDPMDHDKVGERVYMDILNRACKYVSIMSPYLILDGELETALKFAAERGVEVTLILPGIPDKKAPYALAKNHYKSLLESGIHIFEYEPGFVHAKMFLADDREAVVGTINLDYRSLYHHFECATYMYGTSCIGEIKEDFANTLKQCRRVTKETAAKEKWYIKLSGRFFKAIAPLM